MHDSRQSGILAVMPVSVVTVKALRESPRLVGRAIRDATARQAVVAVVVAALVAVVIGVATVLIPNSVFGREIAPVAWNYPVLVITAVLSGLLAATYVRTGRELPASSDDTDDDSRPGKFAIMGATVSWFAVGCPVCNKLALLAFGYTGALTWFAPFQPVLAVLGIALLWTGLAVRLQTRQYCPTPAWSNA